MASSATICGRAPAPGVALDEREHERAEADRDRGDAGEVDVMRSTVSSRDSRAATSVTTTASAATGTLRKKIDCQETFSTRKPPTTGPIASASALTPAHVPIALPRSCGGKALVMIERVAGIMNAAPMPWAARPGDEPGLGLARGR